MFLDFPAVAVSIVITLSYLILYTAYDKQKKTIVLDLLNDLFLIRRGWDWTLVEINKLISLAGLTILLLSFLPFLFFRGSAFLWIAHTLITVHSLYSMYKFYGFSVRRLLNDKPIKQLSIVLGSVAQLVLWAREFNYVSNAAVIYGVVFFGLAHFWTMEVDYKFKLQVRPYAYLPFVLGGAVMIFTIIPMLSGRS